MIIQCKQCRTKFRFDDSNMQGSGIWLRCSRCGHVYFQENPKAKQPAPAAFPEAESEKIASREEAHSEAASGPPAEPPSVVHRDEQDKYRHAARKRVTEDIDLSMEKAQEESVSEKEDEIIKPQAIEKDQEAEQTNVEQKSVRKRSGSAWKIALWSALVIVIIPLVIYFFALPQYGEQLVKSGEYLINQFNEYTGISKPLPTSGAFINQMVKLQDVRYRRINNYILGQIGVLEGTAMNRAEFPLARIQVKGEIVDAYSVVLGERSSYAGNILTDEELTNLSEEEIIMKLLQPEGLENSNDKIMPNGQIPFMIVFPNEPLGVIKTTVVTIGAERLLSE
ncbi:MAG: zinc-ribbon domain-containing protein [Smithella sp.]